MPIGCYWYLVGEGLRWEFFTHDRTHPYSIEGRPELEHTEVDLKRSRQNRDRFVAIYHALPAFARTVVR
jgi:hypothetical protein